MKDTAQIKDHIDVLKNDHNLELSLYVNDQNDTDTEALDLLSSICADLGIELEIQHPNVSTDTLVEKIKAYIIKHHTKNISSNEICEELNCSRSSISHKFKTETGMSIREYITELRLADAKLLLENTNLNIVKISYAVGFNSSNYFSNIFKERFGISPGKYKKKFNNKNAEEK